MGAIDRKLYDAICNFDYDEDSRMYYYETMFSKTGKVLKDGHEELVREKILRVYAMLFCDELDLPMGALAGVDEVEATADRIYIGQVGFDPDHWYRMHYHFPVIDEDNYDRFAALVISDMNSGELYDSLMNNGETLVVGALDPLSLTAEERKNQKTYSVSYSEKGGH